MSSAVFTQNTESILEAAQSDTKSIERCEWVHTDTTLLREAQIEWKVKMQIFWAYLEAFMGLYYRSFCWADTQKHSVWKLSGRYNRSKGSNIQTSQDRSLILVINTNSYVRCRFNRSPRVWKGLTCLSFSLQSCRAEESQARPKDPLGRSLPDVGLEQWFEFREDQLQPLEPPLPQTAAQPHEVWIQGPQTLQYPSSANHIHRFVSSLFILKKIFKLT